MADLMTIKKSPMELIEGFLFRFQQVKCKCFSQMTKDEMVEIVVVHFNFVIQKRLINQNIANMAQLVKKVKQIEQYIKKRIIECKKKKKHILRKKKGGLC